MRRFLLHVLPSGFHRIRHYGLLANANRKTHIATARELLHQPAPAVCRRARRRPRRHGSVRPTFVCRHCGAPMLIIETFARAQHIRGPPAHRVHHERRRSSPNFPSAFHRSSADANARGLYSAKRTRSCTRQRQPARVAAACDPHSRGSLRLSLSTGSSPHWHPPSLKSP